MRDDDNGSEQQSSWQPPEYVSPWASASSPSGDEGPQDTIAFGGDQPTIPPGYAGQQGYPTAAYGSPGGHGASGGYDSTPGASGYSYGSAGSQASGSYGAGGPQAPGGYGSAGSQAPGSYGPEGSRVPGGYGPEGSQAPGGYGTGGPQGPGGYGTEGPGGFGQGGWPGYGVPDMPDYGGRQRSPFGRFLVYVAVAVLAAGAGAGAAVALNNSNSGSSTGISSQEVPAPSNNNGAANGGTSGNGSNSGTSSGSLNTQAIASKVDPGLVDVVSTLQYSQETAEGTGMVLSADGLVLTNNHVINQATSVKVTLVESGKTYKAQVVGYDSTDDVALLKLVGASGLKTVSVGNSSDVKVGDKVLALGNAEGRGGLPSTAAGTITGLDKTITAGDSGDDDSTETLHDMLQTNAGIQEGDSGGPLVNSSGYVLGMDTAANNSGSEQFGQPTETTGYAIPINNALSIARNIAAGKASSTVHIGLAGFMGVGVQNVTQACPDSSGGFGGNGNGAGTGAAPVSSGALICSIYQGTPAANAGLNVGDVITAVNGQTVGNETTLTNITATSHPGDKITVTYVDSTGAKHTVTFSLLGIAK